MNITHWAVDSSKFVLVISIVTSKAECITIEHTVNTKIGPNVILL